MFENVLNNATSMLSVSSACLCTGASLLCGLVIAVCYYFSGKRNKNFCISLAILPVLVQTVIMLVNGNLGTGVAIVGAFSLIRFRSVPGSSREISSVFLTMVIGLATGIGLLPIGKKEEKKQTLKITMYEDLDYTTVFDDVFEKFLKSCETDSVKTINMGSMYQITYIIQQKDKKMEKEFLDELRCRNGNLTITCGRVETPTEQL